MADYPSTMVTGTLGALSRTMGTVQPRLRFVCQGRNGTGTLETWTSEGRPDLKPTTHTNAVVIGQWYSAP